MASVTPRFIFTARTSAKLYVLFGFKDVALSVNKIHGT